MRYCFHEANLFRVLVGVLLFLGAALWSPPVSVAQFDTTAPGSPAEVGGPVPAFEMRALRDSSRTFRPSDFEGQYLLLNLWATWCAPCLEKIPALRQIRDRYDAETLSMLNVSFDNSRATARAFLEKRSLPGKHAFAGGTGVLSDPFGTSFATVDPDDPKTRGLPNVTLVAPDGEVLARLRPPADGLSEVLKEHLPDPAAGE
jgi:thiol-disulfide isomerase/thioredoxin